VGVAGFGGGVGLGEGGGCFVGLLRLEGEVDDEGLADDGFARDEAPVATVFAVVAVVAEDEVVTGGDDEIIVFDEGAHADPPAGVDLGIGGLEAGEVVAEVVGRAGEAVVEAEVVAGEADDAFDKMEGGVDGIVEDDDVAAVDGCCGKESACAIGGCGLLVDEEEVAD